MVTLASSNPKQNSDNASGLATPAPRENQRVNGFPAENTFRDLQFKLAHNLQSSLDLHTTLDLFFTNIQEAVELHGLIYQTPDGSSPHSLGTKKAHTASYTIGSHNIQLGCIEFSRSKRFLEAELAVLEMMVGVLFYPLRNALLYQQALKNSFRDSLTGVGNRSAFDTSFQREIKLAQRHSVPLSLMVVDIDHFKKINDNHGHQHGDRVLRQVADLLQKTLRETDQVFRYGGEEFVILLNNTEVADASLIAERIRMQVALSPCQIKNALPNAKQVFVTISAGVSQLKLDDTAESVFERADQALYQAKSEGRNCVRSEAAAQLSVLAGC